MQERAVRCYDVGDGAPWLAVTEMAIVDFGQLERLAERFSLPRPVWPPHVVRRVLREAGV